MQSLSTAVRWLLLVSHTIYVLACLVYYSLDLVAAPLCCLICSSRCMVSLCILSSLSSGAGESTKFALDWLFFVMTGSAYKVADVSSLTHQLSHFFQYANPSKVLFSDLHHHLCSVYFYDEEVMELSNSRKIRILLCH